MLHEDLTQKIISAFYEVHKTLGFGFLEQVYQNALYQELIDREEELLGRGIQITDDASVVELLTPHKVKLVAGSYENIKITTPEDLRTAEAFLQVK